MSTKLELNGIGWTNVRRAAAGMAVASAFVVFGFTGAAGAATYTATTFADENDPIGDCPAGGSAAGCSLREAVKTANATPDDDVVVLSAGTYELLPAQGAIGLGAGGSGTLVVRGAGARSTTVDAGASEANPNRAFVFNRGDTSALEDLAVTGGFLDEGLGGAILVEGLDVPDANATLTRVWVHDNSVVNASGGAINNEGKLLVDRSLLSGNEAEYEGGAIRNRDELTLRNSTVSGNRTTDEIDGDGGGIANDGGAAEGSISRLRAFSHNGEAQESLEDQGILRSQNSTIAFNTAAGNGGGVWTLVDPCQVNPSECQALTGDTGGPISRFHNSIVSDNTADGDSNCSGNQPSGSGDWTSSEGFNLEDGDSCAFDGTGDKDAASGLAALADNGGRTDTHKLNDGSAAIDGAESDGCPSVDQRDVSRPQRTGCDIGAFEREAEPAEEEPEEPEQPQQQQPQQPLPNPQQPEARGPSCLDTEPPLTTLDRDGLRVTDTSVTLSGISRDRGQPCASGVQRVEVSLAKVSGTALNCRFLRRSNRFLLSPFMNCRRPIRFIADGTSQWQFRFRLTLKPGIYRVQARGYDEVRNKETPKKRRNIVKFRVK